MFSTVAKSVNQPPLVGLVGKLDPPYIMHTSDLQTFQQMSRRLIFNRRRFVRK